jgi:anti-sigma factor RsiW
MKCRKVKRLLSDYLDNSLKSKYTERMKQHLSQCSDCADTFNSMKKADKLLKLKIKEKPSEEYWENYLARLDNRLDKTIAFQEPKEEKRPNILIPKFSPAFSGVLIALLILINGILYIQIREISSLQTTLSKQQEYLQKEISRYLTKSKGEVILLNLK